MRTIATALTGLFLLGCGDGLLKDTQHTLCFQVDETKADGTKTSECKQPALTLPQQTRTTTP